MKRNSFTLREELIIAELTELMKQKNFALLKKKL